MAAADAAAGTEAGSAADVAPPSRGAAPSCANCAAPLTGPYCALCGQPVQPARLTVRVLAGRLAETFDLERGVAATTVALFRRPHAVIADYLRGRTIPWTNPVKHFALVLSLVQLVALAVGASSGFAAGLTDGHAGTPGDPSRARMAAESLDRWFVLLTAPGAPLLALVQQRVFRRAGRTYGEHLAIALFVAAQQLLLWIPALVAASGALVDKRVAVALFVATLCAATLYHAWAAGGVLGAGRASRAGIVLRSIATLAITALLYVIGLSIVFGVLLR